MIGTMINLRYRVDVELGRGGTGIVYRAHDTLLERDVAVKVLHTATLGIEGRNRLLHEAQAAARLNHPNIVSVYDAGEADGNSYIIMELLLGESLYDNRPRALEKVIPIARQICTALQHAHSNGIVHRDLKLENVIVTRDGIVKLTDFGLARSIASRITQEGGLVGTVYYLAPEQAMGQEIDGRADLYALGVMLYELVTGRLPFTADDPLAVISQHLHAPVVPPRTYAEEIPSTLDSLIVRLLNKRPQDRPSSAQEVEQVLKLMQDNSAQAAVLSQPLNPLDRLRRGRLVAREVEFTEARALWFQAAAGSSEERILIISGEPGVGKSPLVREILTLAEVSGGSTFKAECYAEGSGPYAPLAQVIRSLLAPPRPTKPGGLPEESRSTIQLPNLVLADLMTLAPDLRAHYPDLAPNPTLDPASEQHRLFESFITLVATLSAQTPLLFVIEDIHWADGGTLGLLRHLARRSRQANQRLLILTTYREVEIRENHPINTLLFDLQREHLSKRIKLGRYTYEQTQQVLEDMLQEDVPAAFLDAVFQETEGNLFFLEEIVRALVETEQLRFENGHWQYGQIDQIQLPPSVRATIQSRVTKLPESVQDTLRLAAILGREFDFETLVKASDQDEETLIQSLETAENAQLIVEVHGKGRETFAFAHGLIPTTLRESISTLRRHRLHRRVAAVIESSYPDHHSALAYHYEAAGDEEKALNHYTEAGNFAAHVYANSDAIRFYSEALALTLPMQPERFDLLAARARIYDLIADRQKQHADLEAMLDLAEKLDDDARRVDALVALADYYIDTELNRAHKPAMQARELAQKLGDPVREAHALRRLGYEARNRSDHGPSRDALEAAVTRFREAGLINETATCLHMLSLVMGDLGDYDAARRIVEESVALSRKAGDRLQEATGLRRLAIVDLFLFRFQQALPYAQAALAIHEELGDLAEQVNDLNVLGLIKGWTEDYVEGENYLRQSLELAQQIGAVMGVTTAVSNLVEVIYRRRGEIERGLAVIEEQLEKRPKIDNPMFASSIIQAKVMILTYIGQYAAAFNSASEMMLWVEAMMSSHVQGKYLGLLSHLLTELGRWEQARTTLKGAVEASTNTDRVTEKAELLSLEAYLDLLEGGEANWKAGIDKARQAIALLEGTPWPVDLASVYSTAAQLQVKLGACEDALKLTDRMMELVESIPVPRERYWYVRALALSSNGQQAEADRYIRQSYELVMDVADKFSNPDYRHSWLETVRVNREIISYWTSRNHEKQSGQL